MLCRRTDLKFEISSFIYAWWWKLSVLIMFNTRDKELNLHNTNKDVTSHLKIKMALSR